MARRRRRLKGRGAFYMMRRALSNLALALAVFGGPLSAPSRRRGADLNESDEI